MHHSDQHNQNPHQQSPGPAIYGHSSGGQQTKNGKSRLGEKSPTVSAGTTTNASPVDGGDENFLDEKVTGRPIRGVKGPRYPSLTPEDGNSPAVNNNNANNVNATQGENPAEDELTMATENRDEGGLAARNVDLYTGMTNVLLDTSLRIAGRQIRCIYVYTLNSPCSAEDPFNKT
jgi:hypothetical protein